MQRVFLIIGVFVALLAVGCGSDDSSTTSSSDGGETTSSQQADASGSQQAEGDGQAEKPQSQQGEQAEGSGSQQGEGSGSQANPPGSLQAGNSGSQQGEAAGAQQNGKTGSQQAGNTGSKRGGKPSSKQSPEAETGKSKPQVEAPGGTPPKELVVKDLDVGTGAEANKGDDVKIHYVGTYYKNGKAFDSSWDRGVPFQFPLGTGAVLPGWEQGIEGMKVGGRRELTIPPELGYSAVGSTGEIPPNETLIFVIDLIGVEST